MNKRLSFLNLPDEPLHNIYDLLGPIEYVRLAATCTHTRLVPKVQKTTDHINTIKRAMKNASTPCPTELILKYRPFSKSDFRGQLDDYIQSYINTNLQTEKTVLFEKLQEKPESNESKTAHTQDITTRVTNHPLLVFATDEDGETPLHCAAERGHAEIAKAFITAGADVKTTDEDEWTPLHWAGYKGHKETVTLLLARGADVNATSNYGFTPLHMAAYEGHSEIAPVLITAGAEVSATTNSGATPLHWAAHYGYRDMSLLLSKTEKTQVLQAQNQTQQFQTKELQSKMKTRAGS